MAPARKLIPLGLRLQSSNDKNCSQNKAAYSS
jgi:hypothetical protein